MSANISIKSNLSYCGLETAKEGVVRSAYERLVGQLAHVLPDPELEVVYELTVRVTPTSKPPPLTASTDLSAISNAHDEAICDVCGQVQRPEQGDSSIIEGLCSSCTLVYYDALKDFSEDFAFAALDSQDAIRLLVLRLRVGRFDDIEDIKGLLNEHAAEVLERLPASFAPWWRDAWNWTKSCEMKAARKAVGWTLTALNAPPLQRLAAMFAAEQDKVKEMEARHQRELEEAWEAGAMQGGQDMEDVMKDKLEELEAKHKKQMAGVAEASAEASNAVGEAAEKIRHDARRRGYADGYAFADQKATKVIQAMRADLEAARKEGENHQAGYIRLIGERDEVVLEVVDLRQELYASAEAKEKLEAQSEALRNELDREVTAATKIFQAMRADLEGMRAENKALKAAAAANHQAGYSAAEATAWEKEEIERLPNVHAVLQKRHADMAKRDMEAKGAEIKKLEAQVADHSRWRDEANHAAAVAELEAKKLRTKLAEADWDKEQLLKAVEALRELVGPTQKLMKSNPELFGGEARGSSSPKPPPIVRLPQVKEEDTERVEKFLKELVRPVFCKDKVEPSTEGLCMALTKADMVDLHPQPVSAPAPEEAELPDQLMSCGAAGCYDCPAASAPVAEAKPKPNYNHPFWPSPMTKRFAKHLAKHPGCHDPKTIKTHQDALEFIAKRGNISVETLLQWTMKHFQSFSQPWTLVEGPNKFHMGTAPATWWC